MKFCKTAFNIIDFIALLAAVVELFSLNLPVDPTLLRLCRLAKLFRRGWFQNPDFRAEIFVPKGNESLETNPIGIFEGFPLLGFVSREKNPGQLDAEASVL